MNQEMSFENLAEKVENVHNLTSSYAKGAVNQLLTVRNWVIGYYIVEYEQKGKDRAEYGTKLLSNLAGRLRIKGLDRTPLNLCRLFYTRYPWICATVSHKFETPPEILNDATVILFPRNWSFLKYPASAFSETLLPAEKFWHPLLS